jgi:choline dehydrogenase-like flavoprotein
VTTPQGRNSVPNPDYEFKDIIWDRVDKKLHLQKTKFWNHKTKKFEAMRAGAKYEYMPIGAIWDPNTGLRCEGNASCVPICPVQAKYNALKTLRKAHPQRLEIKTQSVASKICFDPQTGEVTGIEYKTYRYENSIVYDTHTARGKVYVLAASAIENAKIMLASGAINKSGQLGCNLMDHLCLLTWGLLPEGKPGYPYRGPGSTTNIPTFRDGDFRKDHTAWICPIDNWGWQWPTFAPGSDLDNALKAGLFGAELRKKLASELPRQVLLHSECEQDPQSTNRVTIDSKYRDPLGNYRPVIEYDLSNYVKDAFVAARNVSNQIFANAGMVDYTDISAAPALIAIPYEGKTYKYGGAGHIVGTHRMGQTEDDSVVDQNGRSWGHQNLYLVGCGNMPTLGTSNPTLTMTALTFKTAEAILKELDQQ